MIDVKDVDALYERIKKGGKPLNKSQTEPWGGWTFIARAGLSRYLVLYGFK